MEGKDPIPPKAPKEPKEPKAPKEPKEPKAPKAKKAAAPAPASPASPAPASPAPASPAPASPKAASPAPKSLPAPTEAQVKAATLEYDDEMRSAIREENEGYGWEAVLAGGLGAGDRASDPNRARSLLESLVVLADHALLCRHLAPGCHDKGVPGRRPLGVRVLLRLLLGRQDRLLGLHLRLAQVGKVLLQHLVFGLHGSDARLEGGDTGKHRGRAGGHFAFGVALVVHRSWMPTQQTFILEGQAASIFILG
jgi:hypothetical protein